jgi:hypothetical protein
MRRTFLLLQYLGDDWICFRVHLENLYSPFLLKLSLLSAVV